MKHVKLLFLLLLLVSFLTGKADEYPWKKYGFNLKVVTLSNGKYQEFHDLEDVVEIGSVLYNTQTRQIVGFVEKDSTFYQLGLSPDITSRWISPDPLTEEYSSWSPYNYAMDNPIVFIDPDGRYVDWYLNLEQGQVEYQQGSENRFDEGLVHLAADDATVGEIEDALTEKGYEFQKDANTSGGYNVDTEAAYEGWTMMQIFSPENVGTILMLASSDFGASSNSGKKFGEKILTSTTKATSETGKGFKSFYDFKKAMGSAGRDNAWHHIVEQTPSNISKFGAKSIHNTNNLIKLPHGKGSVHAKVSGYYSSKQPFTNGVTVRKWLSTQDYKTQYEFGIKMLKQFGY